MLQSALMTNNVADHALGRQMLCRNSLHCLTSNPGVLTIAETAWNTSSSFAGLLIPLAQQQWTIPAHILGSCSALLSSALCEAFLGLDLKLSQ